MKLLLPIAVFCALLIAVPAASAAPMLCAKIPWWQPSDPSAAAGVAQGGNEGCPTGALICVYAAGIGHAVEITSCDTA